MAKATGRAEGDSRGEETRRRIVEAAVETLKSEGFAGASARAIGRSGDFNPALIFYHYGSVNDLLLAALDHTSTERMARYEQAVSDAGTLPDLIGVAMQIYREDLESGHITVLAEMIAGASAVPDLGPEIIARVQPWTEFAERTIARVLAATPFGALIPVQDAAYAVVALYLGIELMTHLEGDRARAERLFQLAGSLTPLLAMLTLGGIGE
jgi:AcrR family transcriptional regulator